MCAAAPRARTQPAPSSTQADSEWVAPSLTRERAVLNVVGDTATIGYTGKISAFIVPQGLFTSGLVRVVDRGGVNSSLDTFEVARGEFSETPVPGPLDCSTFTGGGEVSTNDLGDIIVTDAFPLPTLKEQCKGGGWRSYADFTSQGQCVAFVQRRQRP